MKQKRLLVISHTEHYLRDGEVVGWGPTVREINHLLTLFVEIWHIAVLHQEEAPKSSIPYCSDRIHFVPIKPFGGENFAAKLSILFHIPSILLTVLKTINKVDFWQFRAPTGIGVFLIPYLSLFVRKPGWFKYAGNWNQEKPPLGYRIQRYWLANLQKRTVTINGRWPNQPNHCVSFENPCLDADERTAGLQIIRQKAYNLPFEICYIGRVEPEKGILKLLEALKSPTLRDKINILHIIGDGRSMQNIHKEAVSLNIQIILHGSLNREAVGEILKKCHLNILPSLASEGFPKVIAEGAGYGCIPIVTAISSIGQYVEDEKNGFLLEPVQLTPGYIAAKIEKAIAYPELKEMANAAYDMAEKFTFSRYVERIKEICLAEIKA